MKILLRNFNSKVGMEETFRTTIGNDSSHEISNDNGVKVVNFTTIKKLFIEVGCSHSVQYINLLGHLLMKRQPN
jgi:hypothetical protein